MRIPALVDEFVAALRAVGATAPFQDWAQFEPATDADFDALSAEIGCPLSDELAAMARPAS